MHLKKQVYIFYILSLLFSPGVSSVYRSFNYAFQYNCSNGSFLLLIFFFFFFLSFFSIPTTSLTTTTQIITKTTTTTVAAGTTVNLPRPPPRPWIPLGQPSGRCLPGSPHFLFTVMCYNVLCDKYATRHLYGYCPPWALDWEYRKKSILNEIITNSADIICLQEVSTEQFYSFFFPHLAIEGYDGIFSPKSRAKTMTQLKSKHVDGCAIFFRKNKFNLVEKHLMEFNQLAMANADGSDEMLNRVMTKDNIGLAALLQAKCGDLKNSNSSELLLVSTAHIHWDPEDCDVKLIQTMMLMNELKSIIDTVASSTPGHCDPNTIPLILCGDFNSLPNSGVIEFLSSGRISSSHRDFKEFAYKDSLGKLSSQVGKSNEFTHPFIMDKAYPDGVIPYTNYTLDFKGTIDYIFVSKKHLSVMGLLGPLDSDWIKENNVIGFPHPHVPSDHFSLMVQLQLHTN